LDELNKFVAPLIKKGQSIAHIYANHEEDMPCSRRTLYDYIDQGLLSAKNIDLPRKVRYKPRKKRREPPRAEPNYSRGRTYLDFNKYIENNPGVSVVEMDTVEGVKGGKSLLTMFFRNSSLMLCFLLENLKQETILEVFDRLYEELGEEVFQKTFLVILTDRGTEFQCPSTIEFDQARTRRTRLFYCDPQCSWQKGALEKNHEFIRYVVPKGKPFDFYTQEDITLMANHINSYSRDSLSGSAPFDLARLLQNGKLLRKLGLKRIPPDEVYLKPGLLKKQKYGADQLRDWSMDTISF
jgi:IS30 family transposase